MSMSAARRMANHKIRALSRPTLTALLLMLAALALHLRLGFWRTVAKCFAGDRCLAW